MRKLLGLSIQIGEHKAFNTRNICELACNEEGLILVLLYDETRRYEDTSSLSSMGSHPIAMR